MHFFRTTDTTDTTDTTIWKPGLNLFVSVYVSELYCKARLLCLVKYCKYCNADYVNSFEYIIFKKTV